MLALSKRCGQPGQRWAIPRAEVRPGLRGARVEVERRLDGSLWWQLLPAYGLQDLPPKPEQKPNTSPLPPLEEDTSTWQKNGNSCIALTAIDAPDPRTGFPQLFLPSRYRHPAFEIE
ncbi:MAG: hypothetical protein A3H27_14880 [Acidobacteria bacterium RIFCSPLOWO2_02_FULL_59_13]|nr:MAG: hypothetical protein A3H27_14880 [Acidobacteria bacterium RIFCSPLOWO2_02_FULL_59_13]